MDFSSLRKDFPALSRRVGGKPLVYLDSACMSLKPNQVIEAMLQYYREFPACAGRSNHTLGSEATERYQASRKAVQRLIGAKKAEEIVFTRNTTEGINLIAKSLGLKAGDTVLTTDREHNSNLLPWQMLSERKGTRHRVVPSKQDNTFDLTALEALLDKSVKLVSFVHTSNLDGYTLPAKEIIKASHDNGSLVLVDAAQSVPHKKVDVRRLDADFLAFSGHKMLGPTGTGVLYGRQNLLEKLEPFIVGGETVEYTTYETHKFLKPPEKFEAGLQDYAGLIGLGAAADYLQRAGLENIEAHEKDVSKIIFEGLSAMDKVQLIAPPETSRGGIISFNIKGVKYHQVSLLLDKAGIAVRSGQHCAHSWFRARGMEGCVRASLYLYNTIEEAGLFAEEVGKIARLG
jgi:cysteine desulfurase/selenocysteine lyase